MRLQTLAHIHLLLNHFPTVAFLIGLGVFIGAWYVKSDYMKRMSLGIFLIVSLISIPVYMTGKAAQKGKQDEKGKQRREDKQEEKRTDKGPER